MNDFSELENELRKLRPVEPAADLLSRVEVALAQPGTATSSAGVLQRPSRFRVNWYGVGLGLAAAATFIVVLSLERGKPQKQLPAVAAATPGTTRSTPSEDRFVPADTTRVVYERRDEGLHFVPQRETPVRRVRARTQETMQWQNPTTGASLRVSYPSEEVTLIPVSGQ